MNADGTGLRRLTGRSIDASKHEWSPDGRAIAFESRQPPARVKIVNLDGTGQRAVGPKLVWPAEPTWSPDGRWIAAPSAASTTTAIVESEIDRFRGISPLS